MTEYDKIILKKVIKMNEIWRKIEGFEKYEVSNLGRVRSLNYRKTKETKILKLCKDKEILVHKLVTMLEPYRTAKQEGIWRDIS